jgi:hypothetical protein
MAQGISLIVYPVTDLSESKSLYRVLLGVGIGEKPMNDKSFVPEKEYFAVFHPPRRL